MLVTVGTQRAVGCCDPEAETKIVPCLLLDLEQLRPPSLLDPGCRIVTTYRGYPIHRLLVGSEQLACTQFETLKLGGKPGLFDLQFSLQLAVEQGLRFGEIRDMQRCEQIALCFRDPLL